MLKFSHNGRVQKLRDAGVIPLDDFPTDPNESYLAHVPLSAMFKDERAQRPYDPAWARYLTANFDARLVGVLDVSERPDARFAVMDGWHRRCALENKGYSAAPCLVMPNLSVADEAVAFVGLNTQRGVHRADRFFARVTAEDPISVAIRDAIVEAGWNPARTSRDGQVAAMESLERLYHHAEKHQAGTGSSTIRTTLRVATDAWGYAKDAANGQVVTGLGHVIVRHGSEIDLSSLAHKLAKYPGGPTGLLGRARGLRETYRSTIANCIADIVVATYNSGRTSRRMPNWRD